MKKYEALKDPTSMIMSGVESDTYWDIAINAGIKKLLVSYLYIRKKGKKFLHERLKDNPDIKVMIDSGAYTFITKEEEYAKKSLEYWEKYLEDYTNFIRANKDIIFSCVELDIAGYVGFDKVDEWREKYFKPLEEEGVMVCYVWHNEDGLPYWDEMCKKFDYVGFSMELNDLTDAQINKMLMTAKKYNSVVHGFAMTKVESLVKFPFFTCDSTTWLVGTKYGELNWFDGRKITRLRKDKWKRQYKMKYINLGANWSLAEKENPYELIRINLLVFLKAEEHVRKRLRSKMYWLNWGDKEMPKEDKKLEKKKLTKVIKEEPTIAKALKRSSDKTKTPTVDVNHELLPLKKKGVSIKKGVQDRDDLAGKTKFEEFMELSDTKTKTLDDIDFPEKEWFDGTTDDYKHYCKELNISMDTPKEEALDIIWDFYIFLVDDEEANLVDNDRLIEICEFYYEESFSSIVERLDKVRQLYKENALGIRNDFNGNTDDIPDRAKERVEYIEEDKYQIVDIPIEELQNYLPSSMPEVDELDDEILREEGIKLVRDSKGRLLKGQTVVRKPKNIYSDKFPKLACDTCYKAGDCPDYKPGYVCAYNKIFKQFDTRNANDVLDAMHSMSALNLERLQRMAMFEVMDGGMIDPNVSGLIDQNMRLLQMIKDLSSFKASLIAQQKINADGTTETTMQLRSNNPAPGGIIERLFMSNSGGGLKDDDIKDDKEVIDVEAEVVE